MSALVSSAGDLSGELLLQTAPWLCRRGGWRSGGGGRVAHDAVWQGTLVIRVRRRG